MKAARYAIVIVTLLMVGCATYRTGRFAVIETSRSSGTGGIDSTGAIELFRDVASRHELVVEEPAQDPRTPGFFEFIAKNKELHLTLMVDHERISFSSQIYGTVEDFKVAEKVAIEFQKALDERGVRYKVIKGSDPLFWGP